MLTPLEERLESTLSAVSGAGEVRVLVNEDASGTVRGVLIVAQGADDLRVQLELAQAAHAILQVELQNVEVLKMEARSENGNDHPADLALCAAGRGICGARVGRGGHVDGSGNARAGAEQAQAQVQAESSMPVSAQASIEEFLVERALMRETQMEQLQAIVDDERTQEDVRASAQRRMLELLDWMEQETTIEAFCARGDLRRRWQRCTRIPPMYLSRPARFPRRMQRDSGTGHAGNRPAWRKH